MSQIPQPWAHNQCSVCDKPLKAAVWHQDVKTALVICSKRCYEYYLRESRCGNFPLTLWRCLENT